ncbi:class I SAM-dependent methyltransferase, partial [bacterium]|nr:class I SAM-dependent methyltransferase [bacterium]
MPVIPFYGADHPELFAIERRAMDRPGRVISALDDMLPDGVVADIGAGNGFTAGRLTSPHRMVIPVEPAEGMITGELDLPWIRGDAEHLPIRDGSIDGLYATWAYFFPAWLDVSPGLAEAHRVVKPGAPIIVVDNLGGDEFTALADRNISADEGFWRDRGFACRTVDTVFEFDHIDEARRLLGFFFGAPGERTTVTTLTFRVGL